MSLSDPLFAPFLFNCWVKSTHMCVAIPFDFLLTLSDFKAAQLLLYQTMISLGFDFQTVAGFALTSKFIE